MSYWRFYYHIVWATKGRRPVIEEVEERIVRRSIETTLTDMDAIPHAIGFMPDHVHVVVSIPPKHSVSEVVRRMKGASGHALNDSRDRIELPNIAWQSDYGALTFGEKALADVAAYAEHQKSRHAERQTWPMLERDSEPTKPVSTGLSR